MEILRAIVRRTSRRPERPRRGHELALAWIEAHEAPAGGILVHSRHPNAYPEVSGYLVPTLLDFGQTDLAGRILRWLLCIQRSDGSFVGPDDGKSYVFDTCQVLGGLLAGARLWPQALASAERAADYLVSQMLDGGRGGFESRYGGGVPEGVHLQVVAPLLAAAKALDRPRLREAASLCLEHYVEKEGLLDPAHMVHFLAYELDALIDAGRADRALPILEILQGEQAADGSVRGEGGARWVCLPGLAQLAVSWYKVGRFEAADRAMDWLDRHQEESGGFRGSLGPGANYFPDVELSWAAKFYLDAHRLQTLSYFQRNADLIPGEVSPEDGRSRAILEVVRPGQQVAEVGCGKGRFLRMLCRSVPGIQCTGVEISPAMLKEIPPEIRRIEGARESIPCPSDSFDVVFSLEAVEGSVDLEAAITELIRIARPGGWVVVIDKEDGPVGRKAGPPQERRPGDDRLLRLLGKGCDRVRTIPVGYEGRGADGLMVAWRGQKRRTLSPSEWNSSFVSKTSLEGIIERLRTNKVSPWCQEILLATSPGDRVLEVGSGTGEMSLALALAGRRAAVMDLSRESLELTLNCARILEVSVEAVCADATEPFSSFRDGEFDCVFSSGLLEHFPPKTRQDILRECARVTRGRVIALVPNASCLAYRLGKEHQEVSGQWLYGVENPILTLRDDFEAAGLAVRAERSVGGRHALGFLPQGHPLRQALGAVLERRSEEDLREMNQGYLLFTEGLKVDRGREKA